MKIKIVIAKIKSSKEGWGDEVKNSPINSFGFLILIENREKTGKLEYFLRSFVI